MSVAAIQFFIKPTDSVSKNPRNHKRSKEQKEEEARRNGVVSVRRLWRESEEAETCQPFPNVLRLQVIMHRLWADVQSAERSDPYPVHLRSGGFF